MCGIAGVAYLDRLIDRDELSGMCQAMQHRGPDDHGIYVAPDANIAVGFGSQRLSIIDLSAAGHMPMANESGDVVITYNGEIYNHADLRADLEQRGFRYRSRTDTETVLHAYEAFGADCLGMLNGMFALAIHDRRDNQVLVARDRMGIKPLYYFWDGRALAFASELKSLLALPWIQRKIDRRALDAYLSLGYVPAPHTLIEGISKLAPGHYLTLKDGRLTVREYWRAAYNLGAFASHSDRDLIDLTRQAIESAVRRQLMSDVPVGVLLSGGIDSTIVAAMAQKHHDGPIDTFAVGFESRSVQAPIAAHYNHDRAYAALASRRLGTRHHEITVDDDASLGDLLRNLTRSLDEPVWEASFVSIYLLSKLAREHGVKVVLTGDGSDELFAGYPWYRGALRLQLYERLPLLGAALPALELIFRNRELGKKALDLRMKLRADARQRYRLLYDHFTRTEKNGLLGVEERSERDSVDDLVDPLLASAGGRLPEQFALADLRFWVGDHFNQRLDRMSAACSVEARVPFQDNEVVDLALGVPVSRKIRAGEQKFLLRRAFADVLPKEILDRPKRPFAAPQYAWFRSSLRGWAEELLSEERVVAFGILDPQLVRKTLDRYVDGQEEYIQKLSILIMFQLWCEEVLQSPRKLETTQISRMVADSW